MTSYRDLPMGYRPALELNLQTDSRLRHGIAINTALIWLIMCLVGNYVQPVRKYLRGELDQAAYAFIGIILYMILHECIHGIFMWLFSGERAYLGIKPPFTYARSTNYFCKKQYLLIALAPTLLMTTLLAVLCQLSMDTQWFWTFYLVEIVNISGAVSDLYVVFRFWKLPPKVLIHDSGTAITLYVTG